MATDSYDKGDDDYDDDPRGDDYDDVTPADDDDHHNRRAYRDVRLSGTKRVALTPRERNNMF